VSTALFPKYNKLISYNKTVSVTVKNIGKCRLPKPVFLN